MAIENAQFYIGNLENPKEPNCDKICIHDGPINLDSEELGENLTARFNIQIEISRIIKSRKFMLNILADTNEEVTEKILLAIHNTRGRHETLFWFDIDEDDDDKDVTKAPSPEPTKYSPVNPTNTAV